MYLSQLIKNLKLCREGGSGTSPLPQVREFLQNNQVKVGRRSSWLYGSKPFAAASYFMICAAYLTGDEKQIHTVIYDVAGRKPGLMLQLCGRFARFIENATGIFLLIDPKQFQAIESVSEDSAGETVGLSAVLMLLATIWYPRICRQ